MDELIERLERSAAELRAMQILCEGSKEHVALILEPGLDRISLELTEIGLQLRALQV